MEFKKATKAEILGNEFLWKYFDTHKFLYFLFEEKLFFTRFDNFSDPNEGVPYKYLIALSGTKRPGGESWVASRDQLWNEEVPKYQKGQFANCWFLGDRESVAMWNLYSAPSGVALKVQAKDLIEIVRQKVLKLSDPLFEKVLYGLVDYRRLNPFDLDEYNQNRKFYEGEETGIKKDKSYEHEREFRFWAVISHGVSILEKPPRQFELSISPIEQIPFKVIHHPEMEVWQVNNLIKLLATKKLEERLEAPDTAIRKK